MPKTWSKKDERMYTRVYASCVKTRKKSRLKQIRSGKKPAGGAPRMVCKRIAASTVNKHRAKSGRTKRPTKSCPRGYRKSKTGKSCVRGSKRIRLAGLSDTARQRRSKRRAHGVTYKTREQADRRKRYARGKKKAGLRGTRRGISVDRERLDRGGYTSSGQYFGAGPPLYQWWHEASGEGGYVRARNAREARDKAEQEIKRLESRYDYRKDIDYDPYLDRIRRR